MLFILLQVLISTLQDETSYPTKPSTILAVHHPELQGFEVWEEPRRCYREGLWSQR